MKPTLALVLLLAYALLVQAETVRVASFNIHYTTPNQEDIVWEDRRDAVRQVVGEMQADIIAFQEMETFVGGNYNPENIQLDWVLEHYPQYSAGAYGDAADFPITQPIIFRTDQFALRDQGWFFYSNTPDDIYSRTFNDSYPAYTTWVDLEHRGSGKRLVVVNNHFDYGSGSNRRKSARLVAERIEPWLQAGVPTTVLGDFNAPSFWSPMGFLKKQGLDLLKPDGSTFHHNRGWNLIPAIDHILINAALTPVAPLERFDEAYQGIYPSDHYPIQVELSWTGKP
ncbi:endonuclease/exonuclease/phosphatase family protein [Saccharospirillum impatiens]|uniref:endonuclease/exonuclease/phosphatase family protein n=1 Tax=Saccharospirillum impatiens TaxID=169438 RepID=UPI00146A2C6F|nr:endonuclease/exonuclease/phosphatase family protein [Saccharospirillum impatiens]